jgi:hypothetical protein
MKSFIAACLAIVLIAVGANYGLERAGFSSADRFSQSATVRLD